MSITPEEMVRPEVYRDALEIIKGLEEDVARLKASVPRNLDVDDARGVRFCVEAITYALDGDEMLDVERCSEMNKDEAESLAYHIMQWVRREDV
jgi:hypothetical protein